MPNVNLKRFLKPGIALIYYLAAVGSLQLALNGTNASPVWPPSGIAVFVVLIFGIELWPVIWLGSMLANMTIFLQSQGGGFGLPFIVSSIIATGNVLEAIIAVLLLRSLTEGRFPLLKVKDVFVFVLVAMMACVPAATVGSFAVALSQHQEGLIEKIWFTWWLGDVVGILTVGSLLLAFYRIPSGVFAYRRVIEAVVMMVVLVAVDLAVFSQQVLVGRFYFPMAYLILPVVIWATYRFGYFGATLSVLITLVIGITGTVQNGNLVGEQLNNALILLVCFIGILTGTVLVLAAALFERQQAEQELEGKEKRFRKLVENSFDMVALLDSQSQISYISPSTFNILGYTAEESLGRSIFEWIHTDDHSEIMAKMTEVLHEPGAIVHAECRIRHKDSSWRWVEATGHNLLHEQSINAIVVNYRDITERKQAEKVLFESEQRFRTMADTAPVMIWVAGTDTLCTFFNKSWLNFTGRSMEQEMGNGWTCGVHTQDIARCMDIFIKSFEARESFSMDYRLRRHDGEYRWILDRGVPRFTQDGVFAGYIGSCLDITELKLTQEILRMDKKSLQKTVEERTQELTRTQNELKQASRLADIGTLAATVAHELRNPLGVIQIAAYNLKVEKVGLDVNRHLVNIEKKVWEGNQIIDNLLSYSRIKIPHYEKVTLLNLLDDCLTTAQNRFPDKSVAVEKKYDAGVSVIEADTQQIREVFANIVNNAFQAMTKSGGKITLTVEREKDVVKIAVGDTGVGIAKEDLKKVFEPFFTRKSKGTGLGLAICSELVNLHQGRIDVMSQQGKGTTMVVTLPIQRSKE